MCDTIVALGNSTVDGIALLATNSDREPNEGQHLASFPPARHAPGERVRCTYIEIPQVAETYAVLLSKPFWMWGCEMGLNEHGVVIGNSEFQREAADLSTRYADAPREERKAALAAFTAECFARSADKTRQWTEQVQAAPRGRPLSPFYRMAWERFNRAAGMPRAGQLGMTVQES